MPLEKTITKRIIDYFNSLPYGIAEKVQGSSSASGRADINACYKGQTIRIEVKTIDHKNEASEKQLHNLKKWERAGAVVMVVYSLDAVKLFIEHTNRHIYMKYTEDNGCISWMEIL